MKESEPNRIFPCFDPIDAGRGWQNNRRHHPDTRDELFTFSHLILGHFTSSVFLPSILTNGLQPDFEHARLKDVNLPSDKESVYLCSRYDSFYISRAIKHHGGSGIAIVVRVPVAALTADECALSPDTFKQHPPDVLLFLSLCFGVCKHHGRISPSDFVGIYDANGEPTHSNDSSHGLVARVPVLCQTASMNKTDLRRYDQKQITFTEGDVSQFGTINYVVGEDRFQIIYPHGQVGVTANATLDLTDEMIERIRKQDGKLVLPTK